MPIAAGFKDLGFSENSSSSGFHFVVSMELEFNCIASNGEIMLWSHQGRYFDLKR